MGDGSGKYENTGAPSNMDEGQSAKGRTSVPKDEELDLLYRERIYPDAAPLFAFELRPIEGIKEECFVVLDTNQLLLPYTVSNSTLSEIGKVYQTLIKQNRLVVPAQAAKEFVDHRFSKIADVISAL